MAPDDWQKAQVMAVGEVSYGLTVNQARRASTRQLPYLTVANLQGDRIVLESVKSIGVLDGDEERYRLESGDVLLVEGNANANRLGVAALWRGDLPIALHQNHLIRIRPDHTKVVVEWLYRALNSESVRAQVLSVAKTSSGLHTINSAVVRALTLSVPPLSEQRKIAAILSAVDDAIDATRAVIDQIQVVKKAMMAELMTRGVPSRRTASKSELAELPVGWELRPLGQVARVFNGKAAGTGGSWLRVFKTKHVYDGMLRLDKPEYARDDVAAKVKPDTYLQDGDVLTPNMAHGTIGRVAFVSSAQENWTVDGQVMVIRAKEGTSVGRFLFESLSLPRGRQRLLDIEKGGAFDTLRGQTHIYPKDVAEIPIAVPSLEEQIEIASVAASFDEPLDANAGCYEELLRVKQGLLTKLLSGELRVAVDSEQPA